MAPEGVSAVLAADSGDELRVHEVFVYAADVEAAPDDLGAPRGSPHPHLHAPRRRTGRRGGHLTASQDIRTSKTPSPEEAAFLNTGLTSGA